MHDYCINHFLKSFEQFLNKNGKVLLAGDDRMDEFRVLIFMHGGFQGIFSSVPCRVLRCVHRSNCWSFQTTAVQANKFAINHQGSFAYLQFIVHILRMLNVNIFENISLVQCWNWLKYVTFCVLVISAGQTFSYIHSHELINQQ